MITKNVTIKLKRIGRGISPDYNLIIKGDGKVEYYGNNNVKIKGEKKAKIKPEKIKLLLSFFKNIDFFSYNDIYPIDNSEKIPYNIITLSISDEKDNVIKKSITHFKGDKKVPRDLIELENKIDEMAESYKWVYDKKTKSESIDSSDIKGEKQIKNLLEKHEKKLRRKRIMKLSEKNPKKIFVIIFSIIIILVLIFFIMQQFVKDTSNDDKLKNGNKSNIIYMSADEYFSDLIITETGSNIIRDFKSLNKGDRLIIEDNIDNIFYRYDTNITTITFNFNSTENDIDYENVSFNFKGNLLNYFRKEDTILIKVNITEVVYTINDINIEEEIFEEQWPGKDNFINTGSYFPLTLSCIEKIEE